MISKSHMFKRGRIVLVPFPFTDLSAQKVRPALIISAYQSKSRDIIVIFISSVANSSKDKYSYLFKRRDKGFAKSGLKTNSVFRCNKIATLDKKIILGEIGNLHFNHLKQIDKRLRNALGLQNLTKSSPV